MKRVLQTLAIVAAVALVTGGAVLALGLYNVSARVGHLPGVSWALHTTFHNSVRLRAPDADTVPDLSDPSLIELGARHYDAACRTCHAVPGQARTATMAAMVPAPPHITDAVRDWQPNHLHWIVANGIKMTGMPAWPAARNDEVWPVVAFLVAVQNGMRLEDYAALTRLPDGDAPLNYCLGCHGSGGSAHVPRLYGQNAAYLEMSLHAYLEGTRASGIMAHAVSEVPPDALEKLAQWFAKQPEQASAAVQMPDALIEQGRALAYAATGDRDIPACRACHGPDASEASELFPTLSGLPAPYLRAQLVLWRDKARGGGARVELMQKAAQDLKDGEIDALAAYYATLPAKRDAQ